MENNIPEGMKKCSKCGEIKPATAEYFNRDRTKKDGVGSWCKECRSEYNREYNREYYQKNKDRVLEYSSEYRQKNRDRLLERKREYYQQNKDSAREYYQKNKDRVLEYYKKNKDRCREYNREYERSPVGRLSRSIRHLRQKTGATIYLRDMTDEQKEALANQCVAIRTLEKTEKELLASSGKRRCTCCDRVLDYEMFYKKGGRHEAWCRACAAKYKRKYYQKNKNLLLEYERERRQKTKKQKALDKTKSIPDNRE